MRPWRRTYLIVGRSCCDLPFPVLLFRTALDLDSLPGLRVRLKQTMGGKSIRPWSAGRIPELLPLLTK